MRAKEIAQQLRLLAAFSKDQGSPFPALRSDSSQLPISLALGDAIVSGKLYSLEDKADFSKLYIKQ